MIEMILGALLVIAIVCGCMWLNSTAPMVLAFTLGMFAGLMLATFVGLWLFSRRAGP
jgi:hypothetical protein